MKKQLCPKCGRFELDYKPGYLDKEDSYVCSFCGAVFPAEEIKTSLNPDTVQRFPSPLDNAPDCPLNEYVRKKK